MATSWVGISVRVLVGSALVLGLITSWIFVLTGAGIVGGPPGIPGKERPREVAISAGDPAGALSEFNRGAALFEQREYWKAARVFERILEVFPNWTAARFNLALAYLYMQGAPDPASPDRTEDPKDRESRYRKAQEILEGILRSEPDHIRAQFCLGLCYRYCYRDLPKALECFAKVRKADPRDPYAAYEYAFSLLQEARLHRKDGRFPFEMKRFEEAAKVLEQVTSQDPSFPSAFPLLQAVYRLTGRSDEAEAMHRRWMEFRVVVEKTGIYLRRSESWIPGQRGRYALPLGPDGLPLSPAEDRSAPRILFSSRVKKIDARTRSWDWAGGTVGVPGIATGDFDNDGDLDLCLTAVGERGGMALCFNDGKGSFAVGPRLADQVVSPSLGDVDDDGDLDLWLGCVGGGLLLLGDGKGGFSKASLPPAPGEVHVVPCARLLDIDCEGDLDLLSTRLAAGSVPAGIDSKPAPSGLYRNNGDGTFSEIAASFGLLLADTPVATVACDDFDDDRDLDLIVFAVKGKSVAWLNGVAGRYRLLDAEDIGLTVVGVVGAATGDPNKDGNSDLLVFTGKEVRLFLNQGWFRFEEDKAFASAFGKLGGTGGQFADVDNDGDLDLVLTDAYRHDGASGPVLLVNDWPRRQFLDAFQLDRGNALAAVQTKGNSSCVVADFTGDGRCDILLAPIGEEPILIENLTPGGHWIELDLAGVGPVAWRSRSNNSAIGARVELKTGRVFQPFTVGAAAGPVSMPPLRIHAGLGSNSKMDWLRILWPSTLLQAEMESPADRVMRVEEEQKEGISCPHLFAWNGSRWEFVSDFGGVGGLGYLVAPGTYAKPDPTEYLRIPRLEPLGEQYVLQVVEPLEEVLYLDEAKLIAVDHPAGTEVYPHEMMAFNGSPPPFEVFCFRKPIEPVRAVDHRGRDITEELRAVDRRYAGATDPHRRFRGYAQEHLVELDLGDRLGGLDPNARLVLFLYGWVEYAYSSTNYAASQAGMRLEAPSIHVLRDGRWIEVVHEVGIPAGVQHMMTIDVTGRVLPRDRKIRILSNMTVYWDRIFLAEHLSSVPLSLKEVPATTADLHFLGYPRSYSPDGHRPNLWDHGNVDRTAGWRLTEGNYTRYGEVSELLQEADDCYVIMRHGDEVTLRFPVKAFDPVPEGCRRTFILKADSHCKDMDPHTAHCDTVHPLPFHGMSGYPYGADERYPDNEKTRAYLRLFNTRRIRVRPEVSARYGPSLEE